MLRHRSVRAGEKRHSAYIECVGLDRNATKRSNSISFVFCKVALCGTWRERYEEELGTRFVWTASAAAAAP